MKEENEIEEEKKFLCVLDNHSRYRISSSFLNGRFKTVSYINLHNVGIKFRYTFITRFLIMKIESSPSDMCFFVAMEILFTSFNSGIQSLVILLMNLLEI